MEANKMWKVLSDMNLEDAENETTMVQLSKDVIELKDLKKSKNVTFGLPLGAFKNADFMKGKTRLVMMIIDGEEFDKRMEQ